MIESARFTILLNQEPQKMKRYLSVVALFLSAGLCVGQSVTYYRFDKTFISNNYSDSAIGNLTVTGFHPAANVHGTSCGGDDGELHIGFRLPEVNLPIAQMPLTAPPSGTDVNWGAVAELPNASEGNGPSLLAQLAGMSVTFHGYFRVWDEGHGVGQVFVSNPHHIFEVHPAWGFDGGSVHFMQKDLIKTMSGYRGYGRAKYVPMFQAFSNGTWPRAYQNGQRLYLGLVKNANFYQIPVKVKSIVDINGGHSVTLDVYSSATSANPVYRGLTATTVSGSSVDTDLTLNQRVILLGFFSVNLKKAMEESAAAHTKPHAVSVKDAIEFFVFGTTSGAGVGTCG
jgi:hypothetical protein